MFSGYQGSAAPYVQNAAGQVVYSGATGERTIQVDQSRQMSTSDLGKDIFSRANPGAQGYVSSASPGNTGTAQFGTASITPGGANVGKNFSVAFGSGSDDGRYWLSRHDDRSVRCHTACHQSGAAGVPTAYTDGAAIDFGGVSVVIKGKPQNGDIINVENIQSANVDVFNTLDNLIKTLDSPIAGDEKALAKLANDLATANKKLSTNYDNVLTVAASVGARMNELEALDATGSQKGLSYTKSCPTWKTWTTTRAPASWPSARSRCRPRRRHS